MNRRLKTNEKNQNNRPSMFLFKRIYQPPIQWLESLSDSVETLVECVN